MKKILFIIASLLFITNLNAQTQEDLDASQKRIEKLQGLIAKTPESVNLTNIDNLARKSTPIGKETIKITTDLLALHEALKGAELPTIESCKTLYNRIEEQSKEIKNAAAMIDDAAADVKKVKLTAAVKANKSLGYSKDVLSISGTESAFQIETITSIMETVKTGLGL